MPTFVADQSERRVRCKHPAQTGTLTLRTRIDFDHSYRDRPVSVHVAYEASFYPDEEFWQRSDDDPSETYPESHMKAFDTPAEREFHCKTFYETLAPKAA